MTLARQNRFLSSAAGGLGGVAGTRAAVEPHWRAVLALALILIAGLAILDDYGVSLDEERQRGLSALTLAHIRGEFGDIPTPVRFYGMAFEVPLSLTEQILGIENKRGAWLFRHLLTHLFFLTGGLFAYFLAIRLFGNRTLALVAMLLFLLHPRLYAHSFFNTKDIPFLTMFMVSLFLTHKAFRRDGPASFILLGAAVGILLNLRIAGIILLAAIPAMRAVDVIFSRGAGRKKQILISTGAFALAAALTAYALLPYLWPDPIGRSIEWWTTLSSHPFVTTERFMGVEYRTTEFPATYVPVWLFISSPPFALLLGLIGAALILAKALKSPRSALRNTDLRLGLLFIGSMAIPAGAILFNVNVYHGWRQLYFLWAPFSLLGIFGMRWILSTLGRSRLRKQAYVGALAGFAAIVVSMGLIHPNQQDFFNFLVDRTTPEHLRTQYPMDAWMHAIRQVLESFAEEAHLPIDGEPAITGDGIAPVRRNIDILPDAQRDRIARMGMDALVIGKPFWDQPELITAQAKVYGNTIRRLQMRPDLRAVYERVASKDPGLRSVFDLYYDKDMVAFVKEHCTETDASLDGHFTLDFFPHRNEDLRSEGDKNNGFERFVFEFSEHGAAFDGKCVASIPAPDYSLALIRARRHALKPDNILLEAYLAESANVLWEGEFRADSAYQDLYKRIESEEPAARAVFDVYVSDGSLVYVKEPCAVSDVDGSFFLHVVPNQRNDLPEAARFRFDNLGFTSFLRDGAIFDGKCVASVPLPEYEIAGVRTGQTGEDGTESWITAFLLDPERLRSAYLEAAPTEPIARSVFDVHLTNGDLLYVKEPCEREDANARFFLHIVPERVGDLPEERRQYGFDNLDFDFPLWGAIFDGRCAARVPLPGYPMQRARTGQFNDAGKIWSVGFEIRE